MEIKHEKEHSKSFNTLETILKTNFDELIEQQHEKLMAKAFEADKEGSVKVKVNTDMLNQVQNQFLSKYMFIKIIAKQQ